MDEISCRALGPVLQALEARGIALSRLTDGIDVSPETLLDPRKRIDWNVLTLLCERLEEMCGGPEALEEFLYQHFQNPAFATFGKIARAFARPRDLYWIGTRWFGGSLFSIVQADFADLPDGRLRETLRIPWPYRDCPQLFHILRGPLRAVPSVIGLADSQVEMEISPRQVVYTITPPKPVRHPMGRLRRTFSAHFALRTLVEELNSQQMRIASQAVDLQRINLIGQALGKEIELDKLVDTLVIALQTHMPDRGIALWFQPIDEAAELELRREGDTVGEPTRSYPLIMANRLVGHLDVWGEEDPDARRPDLLDELIPWIAMALDNARSYAALRERNEGLEERVKERTRDLERTIRQLRSELSVERRRAEPGDS